MHDLTAAHKTLPLPSMVKVQNLENGRCLVLKVNDRGPFVKKRIIDVSARAAHLLGFYHKGLARVRITALVPETLALPENRLKNLSERTMICALQKDAKRRGLPVRKNPACVIASTASSLSTAGSKAPIIKQGAKTVASPLQLVKPLAQNPGKTLKLKSPASSKNLAIKQNTQKAPQPLQEARPLTQSLGKKPSQLASSPSVKKPTPQIKPVPSKTPLYLSIKAQSLQEAVRIQSALKEYGAQRAAQSVHIRIGPFKNPAHFQAAKKKISSLKILTAPNR